MRVAVYAICQDERAHVERFLRSCEGADLVMVADTGSTDGTAEALRAGGAVVHRIGIRPWRFDAARNAALALLPLDLDTCISLDLDEVLNPGWRAALEAEWRPNATRGHYLYAWSHDAAGRPAVEFWGDKIHARAGYRWRHTCHEALYPDRLAERHVYLRGLRVDHWPDRSKPRSQYLPLLQAAVAEEPYGARDAFYLGREYAILGRHEEAEAELKRYLELPGATWSEQNSACMGLIAKCRAALGDEADALSWLCRAAETDPKRRDAWVQLAEALYARRDWAGCYAAAVKALALAGKQTAGVNEPRLAGALPHDLASFAAWQLGHREESLRHAVAAQRLSPEDSRLRGNVQVIRHLIAAGNAPAAPGGGTAPHAAGARDPTIPGAAPHT